MAETRPSWSVLFEGDSFSPTETQFAWRAEAANRKDWRVDSLRIGELKADEDHAQRLLLEGEGTRALLIPGPFEPSSFNRICILAQLPTQEFASISFRRGGEEVLTLNGRQLLPTTERHEFDVVGIQEHTQPFDELLIVLGGAAAQIAIEAIELQLSPADTWLHAGPDLDWVTVGTDARPAWTVLGGRALELRGERVHARELTFSLGMPGLIEAGHARVQIQLEQGAHVQSRELPLRKLRGQWSQQSFALQRDASADVVLRLSLIGDASNQSGFALTRPQFNEPKSKPKTVLFVTSDTHRADYLGAANSSVEIETPVLDALAARGVIFEDAISSSSITVPSHASMLTALGPHQTRVTGNLDSLSEEANSLAEVYANAGFTCLAATSAVILDPVTSGLGQGFARFSSPLTGQRDSRQTIARLFDWLPEVEGQDIFVWLHVYDAHTSYNPPPKHHRYYPQGKDPRDPKLPPLEQDERAYWMPDVRDHAYIESLYRSEVSYLDMRLGRVLELPRFAQGIVAVTADHGESLGDHGVWYAHHMLYPSTLNVPLILAWPGGPAGVRSEAPVLNTDIGRTLLELSGMDASDFPGRSLLGREEVRKQGMPRIAIAEDGTSASIHSDGWFLVLHLKQRTHLNSQRARERHQYELYDLRADPDCARNLVEQEADRAKRMRAALIRQLAQGGAGLARERQSNQQLENEVRALGYAGGDAIGAGDWIESDCGCEWCERAH